MSFIRKLRARLNRHLTEDTCYILAKVTCDILAKVTCYKYRSSLGPTSAAVQVSLAASVDDVE